MPFQDAVTVAEEKAVTLLGDDFDSAEQEWLNELLGRLEWGEARVRVEWLSIDPKVYGELGWQACATASASGLFAGVREGSGQAISDRIAGRCSAFPDFRRRHGKGPADAEKRVIAFRASENTNSKREHTLLV
ncbi:hypothetical protein [Brevibacterium sp. FME17]|uniref:hypothetical protein n=2 Tax=unclassified Brevibacterium TaxID=2614124 RepID=UPI001868B499|nr:hypothetical protein [Brevibacterium sp. FME17]